MERPPSTNDGSAFHFVLGGPSNNRDQLQFPSTPVICHDPLALLEPTRRAALVCLPQSGLEKFREALPKRLQVWLDSQSTGVYIFRGDATMVAYRRFPERFQVAFSFAGAQRKVVRAVAEHVEHLIGEGSVFFDEWFEYHIAGDDADLRLQDIYLNRAELVVVCVSGAYNDRPWTQLEHRAIRALTMPSGKMGHEAMRLFPLRVGDGDVDGIHLNAIVPDVRTRPPKAIAQLVIARLEHVRSGPLRSRMSPASPRATPDERSVDARTQAQPQGIVSPSSGCRYDDDVKKIKHDAEFSTGITFGHSRISSVHLLFSLCSVPTDYPARRQLLEFINVDRLEAYIKNQLPDPVAAPTEPVGRPSTVQTSENYEKVFDVARGLAMNEGSSSITVRHILKALLVVQPPSITAYLRQFGGTWIELEPLCGEVQRASFGSPEAK